MSAVYCDKSITTAPYPPVQESAIDLAREQQLADLQAQAPFGRATQLTDPKSPSAGYSTKPITSLQYTTAMNRQVKAAKALDFRWPFWTGLGLGVVGIALIALRD